VPEAVDTESVEIGKSAVDGPSINPKRQSAWRALCLFELSSRTGLLPALGAISVQVGLVGLPARAPPTVPAMDLGKDRLRLRYCLAPDGASGALILGLCTFGHLGFPFLSLVLLCVIDLAQ